jgi:hypothetical protein
MDHHPQPEKGLREPVPKNAPIWLELHHIVEHEVGVSEPMHLHGEGVAHVDGSPEHVGSVEIHVTLRIRQDLEDEGRRCFDSA